MSLFGSWLVTQRKFQLHLYFYRNNFIFLPSSTYKTLHTPPPKKNLWVALDSSQPLFSQESPGQHPTLVTVHSWWLCVYQNHPGDLAFNSSLDNPSRGAGSGGEGGLPRLSELKQPGWKWDLNLEELGWDAAVKQSPGLVLNSSV